MDENNPIEIVKGDTERSLFLKVIVLFSLIPLFFINLGGKHSPIVLEFIESGHFVVFFIAGLFLFPNIKLPIPERFLFSLRGIAAISFVIESLQEAVGRHFSLIDIYRNLIGYGMGASFIVLKGTQLTKLKLKSAFVFSILLIVTVIERKSLINQIANELSTFNSLEIIADYIAILPQINVFG